MLQGRGATTATTTTSSRELQHCQLLPQPCRLLLQRPLLLRVLRGAVQLCLQVADHLLLLLHLLLQLAAARLRNLEAAA